METFLSNLYKADKVGKNENNKKHTTPRIPRSSPTLVLIRRFPAYLWESGRDPEFSGSYGRMCQSFAVERSIYDTLRLSYHARGIKKFLEATQHRALPELIKHEPDNKLSDL